MLCIYPQAENGEEALCVTERSERTPDLLLTDVVMPHMQGPDLAKQVAALHPEIRVLFMSGYAQPMLGDGGILEEGVILLEKPFTEPVLLAKVVLALQTKVLVAI